MIRLSYLVMIGIAILVVLINWIYYVIFSHGSPNAVKSVFEHSLSQFIALGFVVAFGLTSKYKNQKGK